MSDGEGEAFKSGPLAAMQNIRLTCGDQLQVYTIAFEPADKHGMEHLAKSGGGSMMEAKTESDLCAIFSKIGESCSAFDGLVDQFAAKFSDMVAETLCWTICRFIRSKVPATSKHI